MTNQEVVKYEGVDWMGIFDDNMCKQYFYNKTVKRFDKWAIWSFYKVFHFMFLVNIALRFYW